MRRIAEVVFHCSQAGTLFPSHWAVRLQLGGSRYVHDTNRLCKAGIGFETMFRLFHAIPVQLRICRQRV